MSIHGSIFGNVTRDATTHDAGQQKVIRFGVASNRKVKGEEVATFVNCSWFGRRAEAVAQYITKGGRINVHGEIYTSEYQGKTQVNCDVTSIDLCGSKRDSSGGGGHNPAPTGRTLGRGEFDPAAEAAPPDDDFPFCSREESWVRA